MSSDPSWSWNQNAGGGGGRWVDSTYQYDANGRPLSQQEQDYWRNYDKQRATNAAIANSYRTQKTAGLGSGGGSGIQPILDQRDGTWSYLDPTTKQWVTGVTAQNIWSKLGQNEQQARPEWWYGSQSDQSQDQTPWFNVKTGQYEYKGASYGANDLYSHLSTYQQKLHPADFYGQTAQDEMDNYNRVQMRNRDYRVQDAQRSNPYTTIKYGQSFGF